MNTAHDEIDLDAFIEEISNPNSKLESRISSDGATRAVEVHVDRGNALQRALTAVMTKVKPSVECLGKCGLCGSEQVLEGCFDGIVEVVSGWKTCSPLRAKRDQERLTNAMNTIGLDETKFARGWDELEIKQPGWDVAARIPNELAEVRARGATFYFWGDLGVGKTHAALLICRDALKRGYSTGQFQFSDVARAVRATYLEGSALSEDYVVRLVTEPEIVLLDEIPEGLSKASKTLLRDIIMKRDNAMKCTIMTGNLTPLELDETLEMRGADRFKSKRLDVLFNGTAFREQEKDTVADLHTRLLGANV